MEMEIAGAEEKISDGDIAEVTRCGVLVAREDHERLTQGRRGFRIAYREFLERHPNFAEDAMEPEEWLERDRNPSRGSSIRLFEDRGDRRGNRGLLQPVFQPLRILLSQDALADRVRHRDAANPKHG